MGEKTDKRTYLKPEHEKILAERPKAAWYDEVPEGDFITPYPTYETEKLTYLFEKRYFEKDGFRMKYYFYDPTQHGYDDGKKHPVLIFLHGTGNSLVGDLCINYTGAELYASDSYQQTLGGTYILIPVANEYTGEDNRTAGFWNNEYLVPAHELITNFINEHSENVGKRILLGNSSGGRFVLRLMDNYMDDFDCVIPVGASELGSDEILDEYDRKDKYLFLAMGKRDEFNNYDKTIVPRLERLNKMKHCFLCTPDWVRNGDKGIASISGGVEMGQHCMMNAVQANLMFDDNTPMDKRLPEGLTGWIRDNILNR